MLNQVWCPRSLRGRARVSPDGPALRVELVDGALVDVGTGSRWNTTGEAIAGPLKGSRLLPLDSGVHFAFAWLAFNPDTEIYQAAR